MKSLDVDSLWHFTIQETKRNNIRAFVLILALMPDFATKLRFIHRQYLTYERLRSFLHIVFILRAWMNAYRLFKYCVAVLVSITMHVDEKYDNLPTVGCLFERDLPVLERFVALPPNHLSLSTMFREHLHYLAVPLREMSIQRR